MKQLFLLFGLLLMPLGLLAQNDRVGVGHRQPTEQLDVNGRMRVRTLPKVGSTEKRCLGSWNAFATLFLYAQYRASRRPYGY